MKFYVYDLKRNTYRGEIELDNVDPKDSNEIVRAVREKFGGLKEFKLSEEPLKFITSRYIGKIFCPERISEDKIREMEKQISMGDTYA